MTDLTLPVGMTTIAADMMFPEGPMAFSDGSVVLVDIRAGTLVRARRGEAIEVVATLGGGPNGAAIGPDGKAYVVNNGGFEWFVDPSGRIRTSGRAAPDYRSGWVDRVDLATGAVERLFDAVGGHALSGPNDIVFDKSGGFWFTDHGKWVGRHRHISTVCYTPANGEPVEVVTSGTSFNGVGLAPDERTLYVADTREAALWAYALAAPGTLDPASSPRLVARMPREGVLDSLAVQEDGRICVGHIAPGGIVTISDDGEIAMLPLPDRFVTNICFGGTDRRDAYLTFSDTGRLVHMRWPTPGLALNFVDYG